MENGVLKFGGIIKQFEFKNFLRSFRICIYFYNTIKYMSKYIISDVDHILWYFNDVFYALCLTS